MSEERHATEKLPEEELEQLPAYLDDDEVPATAPHRSGPLRFARMSGSSIAGRDAAAWVTDFLNAAYYRHPLEERDVDDLRLAFTVLTTYWNRTPTTLSPGISCSSSSFARAPTPSAAPKK